MRNIEEEYSNDDAERDEYDELENITAERYEGSELARKMKSKMDSEMSKIKNSLNESKKMSNSSYIHHKTQFENAQNTADEYSSLLNNQLQGDSVDKDAISISSDNEELIFPPPSSKHATAPVNPPLVPSTTYPSLLQNKPSSKARIAPAFKTL